MLISRGATILKTACNFKKVKTAAINLNLNRFSHGPWSYRSTPPTKKTEIKVLEVLAGIAWWWILWSWWTDFDILIRGELPAPVPEHWTDEELGIPPDDQ